MCIGLGLRKCGGGGKGQRFFTGMRDAVRASRLGLRKYKEGAGGWGGRAPRAGAGQVVRRAQHFVRRLQGDMRSLRLGVSRCKMGTALWITP